MRLRFHTAVKEIVLLLIFGLALVITGRAQVSFGSSSVRQLFEQMPEQLRNRILNSIGDGRETRIITGIEYPYGMLQVVADHQVVSHIGIRAPGVPVVDKNDSLVKLFIERVLLRLSLENSMPGLAHTAENIQLRILYQDKDIEFSPIRNFSEMLGFMTASDGFSLTRRDNRILAEWSQGDKRISWLFPNDYQLITGKNKIELDLDLNKDIDGLSKVAGAAGEPPIRKKTHDSSVIVVHRGSPFMGVLSSDLFYRKSKSDSVLVFGKELIPYSASNLFLSGDLAGHRLLALNHRLYGGKVKVSDAALGQFLDYFDDDFQCFVGLENSSGDTIDGTVVFNHKYFNYINLLHFKTNVQELFNDRGRISADFFSNIPMHNVADLFRKDLPGRIADKIDINH